MNPFASPLCGTLLVVVGYMITRATLYHFLPVTSLDSWFFRDCIMTIPRLAVFALLVWLNRRWKSTFFDWRFRDWPRAFAFGGLLVGLHIVYLEGNPGDRIPTEIVLGAFLTTPAVALFEEYAFRGLLHAELQKQLSPIPMAMVVSLLFTVFHIQAQALRFWGPIFLIGVILTNLRFNGMSLWWLVVIHFAVDVTWFFFGQDIPDFGSLHGILFHGGLLVYAVLSFGLPRRVRS
jgi:membrane protease YdiL (CAAX protease family)